MSLLHRRTVVDGDRGAAAVEFALILPVLILILFGVIEFGFIFNTQVSMTQAVREGVRYEALGTGDAEEEAKAAFFPVGVEHADFNPNLDPDCEDSDDRAVLTATLPYSPKVLFVLSDFDIHAKAVMRCGG